MNSSANQGASSPLSVTAGFGVRKRLENGSAIIEDDGIGVRVTANPDGSGNVESTMARRESMMCHADKIDAMIADAQAMLSSPNDLDQTRGGQRSE